MICAPTHSRIVTVDGQRRRGNRTLRGLASSEKLVEFRLACGESLGRAPSVTEKERTTRYDRAGEIVRAIDRAEAGPDDWVKERGHGSDAIDRLIWRPLPAATAGCRLQWPGTVKSEVGRLMILSQLN